MSVGILSGLRVLVGVGSGSPGRIYNDALDDAAEALRNPTDEQVEAIAVAVLGEGVWVGVKEVRAVLAAAAGGDR